MECLSSQRTIVRAEQYRQGAEGVYYRLAEGRGEARQRRLELVAPDVGRPDIGRTSLLHFVHCTDVHLTDTESPGRLEFIERLHGPEALGILLPAYRPQEFLNRHALEALIRTINRLEGSPETTAPVQFLVCTGDCCDSAQWNELTWFVTLMGGGMLSPLSGGPSYEGVAAADWGDPHYWHPDNVPDDYKRRWGFPAYPDLLDEVTRPFQSVGARHPWFVSSGNHDTLINGTARNTSAYAAIVTGDRKTVQAAAEFDLMSQLDRYIRHPEDFLAGPARLVTPDPTRRPITIRDFIEVHLSAGGRPAGHGFTADSGRPPAGRAAYYVWDAAPGIMGASNPAVRLVVLDTTTPGGHYQGSIGAVQLRWLEERLIEVHTRYFGVDGRSIETGNNDKLVILISHHGLSSLINPLVPYQPENPAEDDVPRYLAPEVEALLHRFPNVILWVNGHIHRNLIRPHLDPDGRTAGFWEVTTSSLVDWPCQARLVEVISNGNGTLSVLCTMIDHDAPVTPEEASGIGRLASIHRELAANDPHAGFDAGRQGQVRDRTVELLIPAPFER